MISIDRSHDSWPWFFNSDEALCLALEFLVDASIFYRTMGGLGIAVFRQERMLQKIYILNSVLHNTKSDKMPCTVDFVIFHALVA